LKRRDGDVLALACRGVSVALSARYKSGLEARREQHELILLPPHPTVPSYAATNPLTGLELYFWFQDNLIWSSICRVVEVPI
jgi:hypothetical protein